MLNHTLSSIWNNLKPVKFANGAITGAFVVLFNDLLHQRPEKDNKRDILIERISVLTGATLYEIENIMTREFLSLDKLRDIFISEGYDLKQIDNILGKTAKTGGFARIGSRLLFFGSIGYTAFNVMQEPNYQNIIIGTADIAFTYIGTYGGAYGLGICLVYFAGKEIMVYTFECYKAGILKYNKNMMNNYVGGLAPIPYNFKSNWDEIFWYFTLCSVQNVL